MNLYLWENPYPVSYGYSIAIAVAESKEEAQILIRKKYLENWPEAITGPDFRFDLKVIYCPCAEFLEWAE